MYALFDNAQSLEMLLQCTNASHTKFTDVHISMREKKKTKTKLD